MSRVLATYLNESEKRVSQTRARLEELSGFNSEDVRLVAGVKQQTANKIKSLGLDPADTTAEEVFHTLQSKLKADLDHLIRAMNLSDQNDSKKQLTIANHLGYTPEVMALKAATAKQLLRRNPPKKTMKILNYRSLESMLKRGDVAEIYATALTNESLHWLKGLERDFYRLTSSDFEWRKAEILALKNYKAQVTSLTLFGTVILRDSQLSPQRLIFGLMQTIEAIELLEVDSFYLSLNKFSPNFGRLAAKLLMRGEYENSATDPRHFFEWRQLRSVFEESMDSIKKIAAIHPVLNWWKSSSHLSHEGVSFNLADNLAAMLVGSDFQNKQKAHCINRLKIELLKVYHRHESVKNYFASPFDDTLALANNPEPVFDLEPA